VINITSVFKSCEKLKMPQKELILTVIRHGQTDWNAKELLQGRTDIPLNFIGREQSRLAGIWLKDEVYDKVYVSPLSRAIETAKILLENQGHDQDKIVDQIVVDQDLTEREFGVFEGKPFKDLVEAELASGQGFGMYDPEGSEPGTDMEARVEAFLQKLFKGACESDQDRTSVLIASHGGWIFRMDKILNESQKITQLAKPNLQTISDKNTGITKFLLRLDTEDYQLVSGDCFINFSVQHLEDNFFNNNNL